MILHKNSPVVASRATTPEGRLRCRRCNVSLTHFRIGASGMRPLSNAMQSTRAEDSWIPASSRRRSGEARRSHGCNDSGKSSLAQYYFVLGTTCMCSLEPGCEKRVALSFRPGFWLYACKTRQAVSSTLKLRRTEFCGGSI